MNENVEDPDEFVSEQVQEIATNAANLTLGTATYKSEKVSSWVSQICDVTLKDLCKLNKPFKYTVSCILSQKTGAAMYSATACFWDIRTDGLCSVQVSNETIECLVTIFAARI